MTPEQPVYVLKADGTRELFDVSKLEHSLKRAGAGAKAVSEIITHTKEHLTDDITTHEIYRHAFELLRSKEKPVALKYSLKRAIMELGPSGFPFEDFVAEIFKEQGFETETGKILKGFCVEHEVDLIAWNEKKLLMGEVKFHNEQGIRSDLKVALYVKSRYEDLKQMTFDYGKEGRALDEFWLITNTKFTSTAIEYGSCQGGLNMIGWNYPPVGNLHDMVIAAKLHPITCLISMNGREKKELLMKEIVLCKTILDNPEILDSIGINTEHKAMIMEEIASL